MARRSGVELDTRFRRLMQQLPAAVTEVVRKETAASGELVFDTAQAIVPVDDGDLKASMTLWRSKNGNAVEIGYSRKYGVRKWRRAGWRAHFTEKGTKGYTVGDKRFNGVTHVTMKRNVRAKAAQPFLRPALERNIDDIRERHRRAVAALFERIEKR